ncbi:MAG: hypothetical protein QOG15_3429 [Solirubrobacteraceae bacterium]|jgi:hypothetical protein|nr:hypothetical protein [Solirubrobacteraceae bacterium]
MRPEDALPAARKAAAGHGDTLPAGLNVTPTERASIEQFMEWAAIEPDPSAMRSTRRLGAPITFAKRRLLHILRQYLGELEAQQTRFNLNVVARLAELEERVAKAEARAADRDVS